MSRLGRNKSARTLNTRSKHSNSNRKRLKIKVSIKCGVFLRF